MLGVSFTCAYCLLLDDRKWAQVLSLEHSGGNVREGNEKIIHDVGHEARVYGQSRKLDLPALCGVVLRVVLSVDHEVGERM